MKNFEARTCLPGSVAVPLFLMTSGVVLLMSNLGLVWLSRVWDLWPLLLISAAVEEIVSGLRIRQ
jgi:hypothetical protein